MKGVIDTDIVFAFSACSTSVKTISGLTEGLIHPRVFHSIISALGTHLISNKAQQCVHAYRIHWFYHASKAAGFTGQWNDVVTIVKRQLGGNILQYWGSVLKIQPKLSNHHQYMMLFLQKLGFMGSEIRRRKWDSFVSLYF